MNGVILSKIELIEKVKFSDVRPRRSKEKFRRQNLNFVGINRRQRSDEKHRMTSPARRIETLISVVNSSDEFRFDRRENDAVRNRSKFFVFPRKNRFDSTRIFSENVQRTKNENVEVEINSAEFAQNFETNDVGPMSVMKKFVFKDSTFFLDFSQRHVEKSIVLDDFPPKTFRLDRIMNENFLGRNVSTHREQNEKMNEQKFSGRAFHSTLAEPRPETIEFRLRTVALSEDEMNDVSNFGIRPTKSFHFVSDRVFRLSKKFQRKNETNRQNDEIFQRTSTHRFHLYAFRTDWTKIHSILSTRTKNSSETIFRRDVAQNEGQIIYDDIQCSVFRTVREKKQVIGCAICNSVSSDADRTTDNLHTDLRTHSHSRFDLRDD